ncbi:MAG: TrkA family potassium uptake protein [Acholeplasmatales bacterium]|jgi:trk system potassium uptake protein TrkA|nr:TrkA family potassium uptake protein [Acholeplasmatales bacterium]
MKKKFGVIGIGAFGKALIDELKELGSSVFAIDKDLNSIRKVSSIVDQSAVCDSTDYQSLKEIGFEHLDHVIVAIGDIEDSILTTMVLVEFKIPEITVMVKSVYHEKVVQKLGATLTISPEKSTGKRIARGLIAKSVVDYFKVDEDFGIYEFYVREDFEEITLIELNLRNKYDVSLVLIKRDNETILPKADSTICPKDLIMVVGTHKKINKFSDVILSKQ